MRKDANIGVIGCGNMGEAIARGISDSRLTRKGNFYVYDIDEYKTGYLREQIGVSIAISAEELCTSTNNIIIAVKPQDMEELLTSVWHVLDASKFLISVAAGVRIKSITKHVQNEIRIARVMPNMGALQQQSISAMCFNDYVTEEDMALARKIFHSIGEIIEVTEDKMDAVTAISGSGPAYFFYLAEILEKAAIEAGIEPAKARVLAIDTAYGSAVLLRKAGVEAERLRKRVTSKGGTTEAAFRVFSEEKLEEILRRGIETARRRAEELSSGE